MAVQKRNVKPNDFKSYTVTAGGNDISSLVVSMEVYQDIFATNWTANVYLFDSVNIQTRLGVAVGDEVNISIETENPACGNGNSKKTFKFILYEVSEKTLIKKTLYGYILSLVQEDFIEDIKTRVQKSYKKMKAEEIAKEIMKDTIGGNVSTTRSQDKYDLIIPNMSPFTAINYIANFAQKRDDKEPDWIFYQTNHGRYEFKSVDEMFSSGSGKKLIHKEANYRQNELKEDEDAFIRIEKYSIKSELNAIKNLVAGFFGNKTIAHDIINKKIVESVYEYSEFNPQDKNKKPYKGTQFDDANDSAISYMTLHDGMTSSDDVESFHENHDKWEGSRRSAIHKLDTNRLVVQIPGAVCWWRTLGKMITVDLPPQEDISKDSLDKYYKGSYLVMAIKHTVENTNYNVTLELGKKRLATSLG